MKILTDWAEGPPPTYGWWLVRHHWTQGGSLLHPEGWMARWDGLEWDTAWPDVRLEWRGLAFDPKEIWETDLGDGRTYFLVLAYRSTLDQP